MSDSDGDSRVAVVMITYNRRDEVLGTLGRLTRLPEKPRIILVDNGSRDGTAAAVAERFPSVTALQAGRISGRPDARSASSMPRTLRCGVTTIRGGPPGALRRAADLFDRHPRMAVLTGRVLVGPKSEKVPLSGTGSSSPLPNGAGRAGLSAAGLSGRRVDGSPSRIAWRPAALAALLHRRRRRVARRRSGRPRLAPALRAGGRGASPPFGAAGRYLAAVGIWFATPCGSRGCAARWTAPYAGRCGRSAPGSGGRCAAWPPPSPDSRGCCTAAHATPRRGAQFRLLDPAPL